MLLDCSRSQVCRIQVGSVQYLYYEETRTRGVVLHMLGGWEACTEGAMIHKAEARRYGHKGGTKCYAQALGVVVVGSLLVEFSEKVRVRSGRPSCRASQGQNHGVRRGYRVSGEVRQSA